MLPKSFFVTGDIKLFGFIDSRICIAQGPMLPGHPYTELVTPKADTISLGDIVPRLKGSPADAVLLKNTRFRYSEVSFSRFERAGLYFDTDVVFQGALQPVGDIFRDFFHQENPQLRLNAYLNSQRSWHHPLPTSELALRGSLEHVSVSVLDILTFTKIGISILSYQRPDPRTNKPAWHFGYGFFGDLNLAVPGSAIPLQVTYELSITQGQYALFLLLKDEEWTDIFGIKGLRLRDVQMTAFLQNLDRSAELDIKVEAALELRNTSFLISGFYSKRSYGLEAYIGNLTFQELGEIFTEITGATLDVFDHDVTLNSIYLRIASDGLTLAGSITVNGYSTAEGSISISKDGLSISGGIGHVEFDHFTINRAALDVFIGSTCGKTCTRSTRFSIAGDLSFEGIDLKVGLYTSKDGDGELKWTIFGAAQGELRTTALCSDLAGTFLDISLQGLAFIASNDENPSGDFNATGYPLTKGVQFCAVLDSIPELESLMRGSVKGAVLRAAYTSGKFNLGIILPGERTISFGEHVYTGPLALEIQTGTDLALVLKANLNVRLDTQPEPLVFVMSLRANTIGASAAANMITEWVNPCNVGKNVKISNCALEFGIVYSTFFSTGTPGVIGFAGQLNIGKKEAKVAMKLSQNPKDQLLAASVKDLGVVDLVKFASAIAEREFPEPDNFLHFNNLDLYLSTGTTIGIVEYPAGASLKGDMLIFGKRAQFECTVGSLIKIAATIEHFDLGPLTVKGATKPDPVVDIELSASKQYVLIDGAVELWGGVVSAALHLEANIYPKPTFDFWVDLRLSDLFILKLQAKLTGTDKVNLKDLKTLANADFSVYGLMEQHLVEYVMAQLEQQVESARAASKQGFDSLKKTLDEQEAAFKAGCQKAIDELEAARAVWQQKRDAVHAEFDRVKASVEEKSRQLQSSVDSAEASFKKAIADATRALEEAKATASAEIRAAERDVDEAQRDSDEAIRDAQNAVHSAREAFEREFGSAVSELESARRDLESKERDVDNLDWEINRVNREIDNTAWWRCTGLFAERTGYQAAQVTAMGALKIAQAGVWTAARVVEGTGFVTAEAAIGTAERVLETTRAAKSLALEGVKLTLREVREDQEALVQAAVDFLNGVEKGSDELKVFERAKDALRAGEEFAKGAVSVAQEGVDKLAGCIEFVTFDAAEKALEFAKNNTSQLNLARHAVELAEDAVDLGLDIGSWIAGHGGKLINLTKVEFSGAVSSLVGGKDAPPLVVNIEGTVFGEKVDVHINWKSDFDLVAFVKALFTELWEMIKKFGQELFDNVTHALK